MYIVFKRLIKLEKGILIHSGGWKVKECDHLSNNIFTMANGGECQ